MDTITLEQLQELFAGLRAQTPWDVDGEMLWGYFFTSPSPEKLKGAAEALLPQGYRLVGIFKSEDEPTYVLHVERAEVHTPETLFARNQQFEALATEFELEAYDGMDVNPVDGESDTEDFDETEDDEDTEEEEDGEDDDDLEFADSDDSSEFNGPIENPALVAAMAAINEREDDEQAQAALTEELQRAIYLVPVFGDAGDFADLDDEEDDADEDEDEAVQLLVCTDENGAEFMPLFTDAEALKGWTEEPVSAMALNASEAWDFILSQPECSGAVINPGGLALPLERTVVEFLKSQFPENEEEDEDESGQ